MPFRLLPGAVRSTPPRTDQRPRVDGFSLVELLLVLAVAAVLAMAALPGWRSAWLHTRRSEAVAALSRLQLDQERFHLERGRYAADMGELQGVAGAASAPERYVLAVTSNAPDDFVAEAQATGAQAADRVECRRLAINQLGERSPPAATGCWR